MIVNRSVRPDTSGEIKFSPPPIQSFFLENGLKIFFIIKDELPLIRISFLVNSGSKNDPEKLKGLNNLLAMCIDEGAGSYDALRLADEFELLGAQFSVSSDKDVTVLSLQVLRENFSRALKLFGAVITDPHLAEKDFSREKHRIITRLKQVKAEPDYIADSAFEYFIFGKLSPYSFPIIGTEHTVQNISPDDVKNLYRSQFSTVNSSMVIVGNIDINSLKEELNNIFNNLNKVETLKSSMSVPSNNSQKIYLINKPEAFQTEIRTGHLTTKRNQNDFFQKQILNLVLGGQFSSRLNTNLREKNGYTYGVHSRFNYFKEAGYFAVSTSVDIDNTTNALKEIFLELNNVQNGITNDELEFAKSSLTKRFPATFETYSQIAANISTQIIYNLPSDYFETYIQNVNSVTLKDVNDISQTAVKPYELVTVLAGDAEKISRQISNNSFGEKVILEYDEVFKD